MLIETRAAAPFYKNGFLLACEDTSDAVLIDPGDEIAGFLRLVGERRLTVRYILLTHGHMDHVSGVAAAKRATGAPIGVHRDDLFLYETAVQQGAFFGYELEQPPAPDFFYEAGTSLAFGRCEIRAHHTPGHSPGGICLYSEGLVFTGDTIFAGSVGRTDFPGGSLTELKKSFARIIALPPETRIFSGHGPMTTVKNEKEDNFFVHEL